MTAFKHNLTELSGHLLSKVLITSDQGCELRNDNHPESNRAAKLIDLILNKVELNSGCFYMFIECLKEDWENNQEILKHLNASGKCDYLSIVNMYWITSTTVHYPLYVYLSICYLLRMLYTSK